MFNPRFTFVRWLSIVSIAVILGLGVVVAIVRFAGGLEDTWLCQNGTWVKHGYPEGPKPSLKCGTLTDDDVKIGLRNQEQSARFMKPHFVKIGVYRGRKIEAGIVCYGQLCTPTQYNIIRYVGVKDLVTCKQIGGKSWFLTSDSFSPALYNETQQNAQVQLYSSYVGCEPVAP